MAEQSETVDTLHVWLDFLVPKSLLVPPNYDICPKTAPKSYCSATVVRKGKGHQQARKADRPKAVAEKMPKIKKKCEPQLPPDPRPPLCGIPSGCCFFTGPWTVTRSSLRMLRRVAAFCRPLRPVLLLVSFPRLRSPVAGVLGLCWMWQDVPFPCQRRPVVGILGLCWLLWGSFD